MAELNFNHIGELALTVGTSAVPIPAPRAQDGKGGYQAGADGRPSYLNPTHALIYVGGQPIRWRADGVAVNSGPGMGMFVPAGSYIDWTNPLGDYRQMIDQVQFIRDSTATGNAVLEISFFN